MEKKTVLITGIGGNVGQGILRNIHTLNYDLKIIGSDIGTVTSGNHLVDVFYQVPYSYSENFISEVIKIIENEQVDLIIPSTDYETFILSSKLSTYPVTIACSGINSITNYLDKYLSFIFHQQHNIPFAATCLPSEFKGQFNTSIAKPREGRGSRGLIPNYSGKEKLNDDEYLVQEMHDGIEITTAVYVSYLTGEYVGLITMERSLQNGTTTYCKVVKQYDEAIEKIVLGIIKNSDIKGSFNIQSIVTKDNEIYPFEINCRISGTNSVRSHFGFMDVKYTLDELLYGIYPDKIVVTEGVAFRYLADVIYPNGINTGTNSDHFTIF
jgi:carbamoyl-phosphate synthase large subunit